MPFPLNRVILGYLANIDIFTVLAFSRYIHRPRQFIYGEVLTTGLLSRFLRKNQYVLHHDADFFRLVPRQHVARLCRAVETLRKRDAETSKRVF